MLFWNQQSMLVFLSVTAKALLSKAAATVLCRVKKINANRERALGGLLGICQAGLG